MNHRYKTAINIVGLLLLPMPAFALETFDFNVLANQLEKESAVVYIAPDSAFLGSEACKLKPRGIIYFPNTIPKPTTIAMASYGNTQPASGCGIAISKPPQMNINGTGAVLDGVEEGEVNKMSNQDFLEFRVRDANNISFRFYDLKIPIEAQTIKVQWHEPDCNDSCLNSPETLYKRATSEDLISLNNMSFLKTNIQMKAEVANAQKVKAELDRALADAKAAKEREAEEARQRKEAAAWQADLNGKNPQAMYLKAGKLERSGDSYKARELYTAIADRFPDSPLAVKASDRLLTMDKDAENKSHQDRLKACAHVYVGKEFQAETKFFGMKMPFTVKYVSAESQMATIVGPQGNVQEISCYSIPK